jgi:acyl dehydratase
LPPSLFQYGQAVFSRKPLLAPANHVIPDLRVTARQVHINAAHVKRYCDVCGTTPGPSLPAAYLHVLAMPLHMRLFTHADFPARVLGLVHLRNTIRLLRPIALDSTVELSACYNTLRETESGQEYDLVTTATVADEVAWEEVSTMLARRHVAGKRPVIERGNRDEARLLCERTVSAAPNTGRRYAAVSGDYNPIHLFDRTAQWFSFKQCVAHGMWSLARCVGLGEAYLPSCPFEIDAQFKLPIYLPGDFVFRAQRADRGIDLALSTVKGDRLHLSVRARQLG